MEIILVLIVAVALLATLGMAAVETGADSRTQIQDTHAPR